MHSRDTNNSNKIKIGVDARILSRQLTGIGRYTLEMCHALNKIETLSLSLYSPAPILDEYQQYLAGAQFHISEFNNPVHRQLWAAFHLPFLVRRDKIDIFWGPAHAVPRLLPSNMTKIVTIHDLVWKYFGKTMRTSSRLLESFRMPLAIETSDQIIAVSKATADAVIKEFSVAENKVNVVPLAAHSSTEIALPQRLNELGIDRPYCLFVGTLEPRKNLDRLLRAYAKLPTSLKQATMLVIAGGQGWGDVQLSKLVKDLDLSHHICITGYIEDALLARLYSNALFLAMPSLYEGFGLPIIEANSYGTPVLTSNNSSMPEVAGKGGLLVDAGSVDSISSGMKNLIENQNLRQGLAANARKNAARYSWEKSAKQLSNIFEKALVSRSSHSK